MKTLNREAINAIISENASFGYVASKGEVAQQYWQQVMTASQRFEVMESVGEFKSPLAKLRACLKVIENAM